MIENKKIMNEKITNIGNLAIECLNGKKFNKLILGLIINRTNDTNVRNLEFFYEDLNNNIVYFNKLIYDDKFLGSIEEKKYFELQQLLFEMYEYCIECGDEWRYMTFIINSNGKFSIDFQYDLIEVIEWRKNNGIINQKII